MSIARYRSIGSRSEGTFRELASKFIGIAFPIKDEAQFKQILEVIEKEHPSARHFCFAWVLGEGAERYKANDDGEPSATAGKPILRQLQAYQLTNSAVVVVRYFGGTLLGRPGLINAYGEAARSALAAATIVEHVVMERCVVTCGYDRFDTVKADVITHDGTIIESSFTTQCVATVQLPLGRLAPLLPKWALLGIHVEPSGR
jgi:uncharacterized YigZ family protein